MSIIKKSLSVLLALSAALSSMALTASAEEAKVEKSEAKASYAIKNITIDGVKDDLYNAGGIINIDHVAEVKDESLFNPDFKGKTYTLWDEEYFYVFTEVTDSDVVKNNGGSLSEAKMNDRITYYFDFSNTTEAYETYKSNKVHGLYYGVHCTDDKEYMTTISDDVSNFVKPSEETPEYKEFIDSTFKTVIKYTATGYNAETRIRLSNLKYNEFGTIKKTATGNGVKFGFDVYLHDRQHAKTDDRVSLCTWSRASDNKSWDYPGYLGTLILADKPESAGKNGWVTENGKERYYSKGALVKNKFVTKGTDTVFVNGSGYLVKNAVVLFNGKKYCVSSTGKLLKAVYGYKKVNVGKNSYIVNKSGVVTTNKIKFTEGKKYIASKSGKILKGNKIVTFMGKKYFVSKTGAIAKNVWKTFKKAKYRFGANGAAVCKKLVNIKGKYYYFSKSCKMVKNDTLKIGKKYYYFNGKGVGTRVK